MQLRSLRSDLRQFKPQEQQQTGLAPVPGVGVPGGVDFIVGRRGANLAELLPQLKSDWSYDILSDGHWSLHEMLAYLLTKTGPAHVWLTSWGLTTEPLQAVLDMVRDRRITHLNLLLDLRVKLQSPQAYQLVRTLSEEDNVTCRLTRIHAKISVIRNQHAELRMHTSANLTRNLRVEHYNISTHKHHALANSAWIDELMQGGQPFEAE